MCRTSLSVACAAAALLAAASTPAAAEIAIIGSSDPRSVALGVLTDDRTLDVPAGVSVRIMAPSGKTSVVTGPASRPVKDLADTGPRDEQLWQSVVAQPTMKMRGVPTYKFSWDGVPVFKAGDVCVDGDMKLSLLRASGGKTQRVLVQGLQGQRNRFEAVFADGQRSVPWPDDTPPETGVYLFHAEGQEPIKITLRLIKPRPTGDDALRVLHGQRCQFQKDALLEALRDPTYQVSVLGH